ncbi:MAG: hypothetical protein N2319_09175 [Candidatus Kapabacteria bacterium]|nr:hypothetical protein [Candidatus Kapabacteria bacterium]
MFEQNIESELSRIKSLFGFDKKIIELDFILSHPDLDEFYKIYFSSQVIWWIYLEDLRRNSLINFKTDKKEFKKINQDLNIYYYNNTVFKESDFDILLKNAINLKINFLLRPFQTLQWFIFRTEQQKPLSEISLKLNFFSNDDLLIKFIRQNLFENIDFSVNQLLPLNQLNYFDFYPDKNISKFHFINILNKARESLIINLSIDKILKPFRELNSLFLQSSIDYEFFIPIESILINFDDWHFKKLGQYFENLCINQNLTSLKITELQAQIEKFFELQYKTAYSQTNENIQDYSFTADAQENLSSVNELTNSSLETEIEKENEDFKLLIQPDRAELIRVGEKVKKELRTIISSDLKQNEKLSEISLAASEISKYLINELQATEIDKYLIKPKDLRICDIDEIIIFTNDIDESTLEFEFGSFNN